MARQRLKIIYSDGRESEIKITPKVEVEVEKHYSAGLQALQNDIHAEYLYYMAWVGTRIAFQETRSFEEFLDILDDVEMIEAPETAPFTQDQSPVSLLK